MTLVRPVCSWEGVAADGERVEPCGRPAAYAIVASEIVRVYACREHLAYAKSVAGRGGVVHRVPDHHPAGDHLTYPALA